MSSTQIEKLVTLARYLKYYEATTRDFKNQDYRIGQSVAYRKSLNMTYQMLEELGEKELVVELIKERA